MKSGSMCRPGAAEFPHDNPLLERSVLWVGSSLCHFELAAEAETARMTAAGPGDTEAGRARGAAPSNATKAVEAHGVPQDERIASFVRTITEVAMAHGTAESAAHLESLFIFGVPASLELDANARAALVEGNILEPTQDGMHATAWFSSTSSAWQTILRGESGDLSACGESTLDSWTADFIARIVAKPTMAPVIRRDLRRRGIAAFGMLQ